MIYAYLEVLTGSDGIYQASEMRLNIQIVVPLTHFQTSCKH
jgi:hypothetical protein